MVGIGKNFLPKKYGRTNSKMLNYIFSWYMAKCQILTSCFVSKKYDDDLKI